MNKIEKIHEMANIILKANKSEYTPSEIAILLQSQYYNAETLFIQASNFIESNPDSFVEFSKETISICESFNNNIQYFPPQMSWDLKDFQEKRINIILKDVTKTLNAHQAFIEFEKNPTSLNHMRLQEILNDGLGDK
jgi:hypothetical protein